MARQGIHSPLIQKPAISWTNESVKELAGDQDPVDEVLKRSRIAVMEAMDQGWHGPPFDPLHLARIRGVPVVGRDDVRDARTVVDESGELVIEANPNRPRARMRYSVAHELGHTLFPDCREHVRNRAVYHEMVGDEWQLEALCNIAAAEFLMPAGSFPELNDVDVTIDNVLEFRKQYEVSTEAVLLRIVRLATEPLAMFAASTTETGTRDRAYNLDYSISAPLTAFGVRRGMRLPDNTCVAECAAIGYTAKGTEMWAGREVSVEAVGVPPYPGSASPRVVGLVRPNLADIEESRPAITYLKGDALAPRGDSPAIIAQVVNDRTPNWGGGFAYEVRKRFPGVQDAFRDWARMRRAEFQLGGGYLAEARADLWIYSMVAQEGYGPSPQPRLRYGALQMCLTRLSDLAKERGASLHIPRIGAGQAGGDWHIIEELIKQELCERGVSVTVYDLAEARPLQPRS
jgi:Zn-dependent peptidase ImmA (M78 family)/O-acetyl-ADP-ribose deacetylase (regulator of RNase III)